MRCPDTRCPRMGVPDRPVMNRLPQVEELPGSLAPAADQGHQSAPRCRTSRRPHAANRVPGLPLPMPSLPSAGATSCTSLVPSSGSAPVNSSYGTHSTGTPRSARRPASASANPSGRWSSLVSSAVASLSTPTAHVAGAPTGLLSVAVSVAQERLTSENANPVHRVGASAALTSFSNALAVALFGLVPGVGLRWPALVVGLLGLLFVLASLLMLLRVRESHPVPPRDVLFLAGLTALFGLQLYYALRLMSRAGDVGAARGIAVLVIVCFFIGITRSWELVGGPSIGLGHELTEIVRTRRQDP